MCCKGHYWVQDLVMWVLLISRDTAMGILSVAVQSIAMGFLLLLVLVYTWVVVADGLAQVFAVAVAVF